MKDYKNIELGKSSAINQEAIKIDFRLMIA